MEAIGLVGGILIIIWAFLMFCIPFMIYFILVKLGKIIKLLEQSNKINSNISQNLYTYLTQDYE